MRKKFLFSFLLVFVLCGCQSFPSLSSPIKEPRISLNSVNVSGISFSGLDLIANVAVENLNSFSLPMPKVDWELFITDTSLADGTVQQDRSIGSGESLTLAIPISLGYDKLYNSAVSIIGSLLSGSGLPYRIAMGLSFPIPLLRNKVYNLDYSGSIPLSQIPGLNLLPW